MSKSTLTAKQSDRLIVSGFDLKRLRKNADMSLRKLSAEMRRYGYPYYNVGVMRMERKARIIMDREELYTLTNVLKTELIIL